MDAERQKLLSGIGFSLKRTDTVYECRNDRFLAMCSVDPDPAKCLQLAQDAVYIELKKKGD